MLRSSTVVLVALLLVGCGANSPGVQVPPVTESVTGTATDVGGRPADEGLPFAPPAVPTWDQESGQEATAIALIVMRAYCRPTVDGEVWFDELAGFLTPAAQNAHYGTDPAEVACAEVAGTSIVTTPTTGYLATVTASTDDGPYEVLLARVGAGEPWLVERISPPS